jgi:hypothetical protein
MAGVVSAVLAAVCFFLYTFGVDVSTHFNLLGAGLFFLALSYLLGVVWPSPWVRRRVP